MKKNRNDSWRVNVNMQRQRTITLPLIVLIILSSIGLGSCKKFLEVEPPISKIPTELVFKSDDMANAAVAGIYLSMFENGFASGNTSSISFLAGLSSDEFHHFSHLDPAMDEFEKNQLQANNVNVLNLWSSIYQTVYQANAVIIGLQTTTGVNLSKKSQLRGEALFIRAFCYFYLLNLFGDVPLITEINYLDNAKVTRTPQSIVSTQIEADLVEAEGLLPENYPGGKRIRPLKSVAAALLARFYLYNKDWNKAELKASSIIGQTNVYGLEDNLNSVFLAGSREAIWQLKPNDNASGTKEGSTFSPDAGVIQNSLSETLLLALTGNDKRRVNWVTAAGSIYLPYKYKVGVLTVQPATEYSIVFRLSEQYLIRAEARANLGLIEGNESAESDINRIRNRAGLSDTTINNSLENALRIIEIERRRELFSEWGHRWFDLKRWNRATEVLSQIKPGWKVESLLYPIPQDEMNRNPFLKPQNPGYE